MMCMVVVVGGGGNCGNNSNMNGPALSLTRTVIPFTDE